jgi:hypothetical protein
MLYNAVLSVSFRLFWLKRDRQNCFLFIYVLGVDVALQFILISDKKEKKIFLIYKEIQKGAVAKSYITNGLLIYD